MHTKTATESLRPTKQQMFLLSTLTRKTRSSANAERACDADDNDFSVEDVHSAMILAPTAIQGHSRSSVVVPSEWHI